MGAGRWDWDRERPHSGPLPAPPFPSGASHDCLKPPRKGFVSPVAALPFPAAPRPAPNRRHRGFCSLTTAPAHLPSARSPRCAPIGRRQRGGKRSAIRNSNREPALRPHWLAPQKRERLSQWEHVPLPCEARTRQARAGRAASANQNAHSTGPAPRAPTSSQSADRPSEPPTPPTASGPPRAAPTPPPTSPSGPPHPLQSPQPPPAAWGSPNPPPHPPQSTQTHHRNPPPWPHPPSEPPVPL